MLDAISNCLLIRNDADDRNRIVFTYNHGFRPIIGLSLGCTRHQESRILSLLSSFPGWNIWTHSKTLFTNTQRQCHNRSKNAQVDQGYISPDRPHGLQKRVKAHVSCTAVIKELSCPTRHKDLFLCHGLCSFYWIFPSIFAQLSLSLEQRFSMDHSGTISQLASFQHQAVNMLGPNVSHSVSNGDFPLLWIDEA